MFSSMLTRALPMVFAGALLAPLPAVAQSQTERTQQQQPENMQKKQAKKSTKGDAKSEQAFMTEAAMGNLAETQLGQLALDHAQNEKVKQLGQTLIDDHKKAEETVAQFLKNADIREPQRVSREDTEMFTKLTQAPPEQFDVNFVNAVIKEHQQDIAKYEKWQSKAQDPAIRSYIEETLPTLREHLKTAQNVKKELEGGQTS